MRGLLKKSAKKSSKFIYNFNGQSSSKKENSDADAHCIYNHPYGLAKNNSIQAQVVKQLQLTDSAPRGLNNSLASQKINTPHQKVRINENKLRNSK